MRSLEKTLIKLKPITLCRWINLFFPIIVMIISLTVMYGWYIHSLIIVQVNIGFSPMQFNTALLFLGYAIALLALYENKTILCKLFAIPIGFMGVITFLQYALDTNYGIDTLFITPFPTSGNGYLGRMSFNTSCSFIPLSLSLLLFPKNNLISQPRALILSLLACMSISFGTVSLLGYLTGLGAFYNWGNEKQMSIGAVVCFILVGITLISSAWERSPNQKQWMSLPIFIALATIIVSMSATFYTNEIIYFNQRVNPGESFLNSFWMALSLGFIMTFLVSICLYLTLKTREQTKALLESEQLYRLIIDGAKDYAIFMLTPEGLVKSWNKGAEEIIGYNKEEIIGKHFSIFYTKEDMEDGIPDKILEMTRKEGRFESEGIRIKKDSSQFWTSVVIESLFDENKNLIGFVIINRDISQWRAQEEKLKASEESFRLAMEYAPIGMALISLKREWIRVNQSVCNLVGYSKEELISADYRTFTHPEDVYNDAEYLYKLLHKEIDSYQVEKRYFHKNGNIILALVNVTLLWNTDNTPKYFIVQIQDITKRKELESNLQERERVLVETNKKLSESEKFQLLIKESIPDIIFVKNSEYKIVDGNNSFFNTFPLPRRDKISGDRGIENYAPEDVEQFFDTDKEAFEKGRSESIETINNPEGKTRTLHTQKIRFHNDSGEVFIICIARDISEREKLVQKLLESNTELERFAYVASHDLQEPIRMITSFSKLVGYEYKDKLDKQGLDFIHKIEEAGIRMHATINDLLDYSRLDNQTDKFVYFNSHEVFNSTLDNLEILIEEKKAEITHGTLPQLYGNPIQFTRVLQNLITNAIKYQPADNPPKIHISIEDLDTSWTVSIKDNGLGIPEKFMQEIFAPFKRLHAWNAIKGNGLGLSICKKIIENHHGKIWVDSAPGKGSTFIFTLPKPQSM